GGGAEDVRRVAGGELRAAGGLAQRAAPGAHRDPRVVVHDDLLDRDDQRVAALRTLDPHRAADRVGERRHPVEAGPAGGDGEVLGRLEVAGAGVVGLDLEALAGLDAEEGLVAPVEGVLAGLLAGDELHGGLLLWLTRLVYDRGALAGRQGGERAGWRARSWVGSSRSP